MKTITIILILLLASAVLLFGIIAGKSILNPSVTDNEPVDEEVPEFVEEEPTPPLDELAPGSEEEAVDEEQPDPDKISAIEIYLDGSRDEGIFLGKAKYGLTSKDTYAIYGENFSQSGFLLVSEDTGYDFEPGSTHYLYIYTLIPKYGWEYIRQKVPVSGDMDLSQNIELHIDGPSHNALIEEADKENLRISGWSADLSVQETTGIEKIEIYMNGPRDFGISLGEVDYGRERQDVANAYGNANYANSGYSLTFDAGWLEPGTENTIYVYSYSTNGTYTLATRDIVIEGEKGDSNTIMSVEAEFSGSSIEINGWVVSKTDIQDTGPRETDIEYINKKIVFVSNKNGNEDIFSIDLDGSALTQLTENTDKDAYPSVSTDGKNIAYTADINGYWQIMVMDWDGKNKTQLTYDPVRSGYPTWSFDGRYIFYEVYKDGDWEIYRINSDGSNRKRLTFNASTHDWHPFAHPYLDKVIYESGPIGQEEIYIMDTDGDNIEQISEGSTRKRVPSMSVDGEYILFMGYEENLEFVYIMDGNGENIRKISGRRKSGHPFISPDNSIIAFQSSVDGQNEIFIINMDGSGETRLTSIPGDDWDPAFIYQLP
jgi:Tol biopolymer transport system component